MSLFKPRRLSTRLTVAGETPTSLAMCFRDLRSRRRASIRAKTCGGVGRYRRRGRELRSCRPAKPRLDSAQPTCAPYAGKRLRLVRAACGICPRSTSATTRSRPCGVSLMDVHSVLRVSLKLQQLRLPRSGPNEQPIETSHLGRATGKAPRKRGFAMLMPAADINNTERCARFFSDRLRPKPCGHLRKS